MDGARPDRLPALFLKLHRWSFPVISWENRFGRSLFGCVNWVPMIAGCFWSLFITISHWDLALFAAFVDPVVKFDIIWDLYFTSYYVLFPNIINDQLDVLDWIIWLHSEHLFYGFFAEYSSDVRFIWTVLTLSSIPEVTGLIIIKLILVFILATS